MQTEVMIAAAYNSAKGTATELESIASELTKLANMEYESVLTSLGRAWQGENGERFVQKGRTVKEQLLDTAKDIRNAATELRNDARATYNADMRKLEIAREKERQLQLEKERTSEKSWGSFGGGGSRGDSGKTSENGGAGSFGGGGGGSR